MKNFLLTLLIMFIGGIVVSISTSCDKIDLPPLHGGGKGYTPPPTHEAQIIDVIRHEVTEQQAANFNAVFDYEDLPYEDVTILSTSVDREVSHNTLEISGALDNRLGDGYIGVVTHYDSYNFGVSWRNSGMVIPAGSIIKIAILIEDAR